MIRFILLFAAVLLSLDWAAAAVKPCAELQTEIEAKLEVRGVKSYELNVVGKVGTAGRVVGICEGGAKQIVYLRKQPAASLPAPAVSSAPKEPLIGSVPVVAVRMIEVPASSSAVKSCAELKAEIEAKLAAKGVKGYELIVSDSKTNTIGKVVGNCEKNSKKIIYSKKR